MGVPLISEANKNKELLLEIDSIVPDTKGHHLADISLSSNDSLSRSRRRWKLIKIIGKMNPSFQGKSKKLIFYQSLSAILSIILTAIVIYWLVQLNSTSNSSQLPPSSSSFLISSRSSSASSTPSPPTESPATSLGWPENFDSSNFGSSSLLDNPMVKSMETSNDTDTNGEILKVTDSAVNESDEDESDTSRVKEGFFGNFPPPPPFLPFQSYPQGWFEGRFGRPLFLPPFIPPPPPPPPFQMMGPFDSEEPPTPFSGPFFEQLNPTTFNLAKLKSSAQQLHASAVGAIDDLMKKLKGSSFGDFLPVNGDDLNGMNLDEPELIIRSEDSEDQDGFDPIEGFNDTNQVENLFNFLKKIVF